MAVQWFKSLTETDPVSALDLAEIVITNRPSLADELLHDVGRIYEAMMAAAKDDLDFSEMRRIAEDAGTRFPSISDPLLEELDSTGRDLAEEVFSEFAGAEFVRLVRGGTLEQLQLYIKTHKLWDCLEDMEYYYSDDIVIPAEGMDGLYVGKHMVNDQVVFYVGEYNAEGKRSGDGIQVYFADDGTDYDNYLMQRISARFLKELPYGEFSERVRFRGSSQRDYVVKGETIFGRYNGDVTLTLESGDAVFVFHGKFSDGKAESEADTKNKGKYMIMYLEDGGLFINTPNPDKIFGNLPYYNRLL